MRAVFTFVLIGLMILIQGCNKESMVLFELVQRVEFNVPAGLNPFDKHFFLIREVPTNLDNLRSQFGVEKDQKLLIRPAQAIMSTLFQDIDLDFIEEIEISVFDDDPDVDRIAFLTDQVPFNAAKNIVIIPFDIDLSDQLNTGKINYKVSLRLRTVTPTSFTGVINITFGAE